MAVQVWKLSTGKVVVSTGDTTQVLTPPVGVCYDLTRRRWVATVLNDKNDWTHEYFSVAKNGDVIDALQQAASCREQSLSFLLNRRLLPRIRKAYHIRNYDCLFVVYDPIEKHRRYFTTMATAEAFNRQVLDAWIAEHRYDEDTMIETRLSAQMSYSRHGDGKLTPVVEMRA